MRLIHRVVCLVAVMATSISAYSQKSPSWSGLSKDLDSSRLVSYSASGDTEQQARDRIMNQVIAENSLATGHEAKVSINSSGEFVTSGSHEVITMARRIDEFHAMEGNQHRIYWLVQILKNPTYAFEPVSITDKYNCTAESFIPGMAQIKKGQTGKGIFFIAAEGACIGTIIAAESQRSSFQSKIKTTQSAQHKIDYKDKADNWATIRNVAIAGAAAFYLWNVVDGIMSKGNKRVVIGKSLAMSPWATPDATGLAMRVTF